MNKKFLLIIILILSLLANLALGILFIKKEKISSGNNSRNTYSFLDPARDFYHQDDLIVDFEPLRDELNKIGERKNISIYFEFLNTGANISVNKDLSFWPASLMKIPIAMVVMRKVERGEWKLTNELILLQEDKDEKFGNLYKESDGTRFAIEKLLDEMLINSDNTARGVLMRNIESGEIKEVLEHLGIEDIFNNNGQIGAKKYSILWRALFTSSYLSPEYSQKLVELMAKTPFNTMLQAGLPDQVKFSHKIGVVYDDNIYSDSGVVYVSNRPYIVTVMLEEKDKAKAEQTMKEISEKIYQYVSQYKN